MTLLKTLTLKFGRSHIRSCKYKLKFEVKKDIRYSKLSGLQQCSIF